MYTKLRANLGGYVYHLSFLHVRPTNQPTMRILALKKSWTVLNILKIVFALEKTVILMFPAMGTLNPILRNLVLIANN
jgi:hypothetical protein